MKRMMIFFLLVAFCGAACVPTPRAHRDKRIAMDTAQQTAGEGSPAPVHTFFVYC